MGMKRVVRAGRLLLLVVLFLVVCAGCATDDTLTMTFDGSTCELTGTTDLETGEQTIHVVNTSGRQGWMRMYRGDPGTVWQDVVDFDFSDDDDPDEELEWPTFWQAFRSMSVEAVEGDTTIYTLTFRIDGLYFVIWEQNEPEAAWPCGPITVVEASADG